MGVASACIKLLVVSQGLENEVKAKFRFFKLKLMKNKSIVMR